MLMAGEYIQKAREQLQSIRGQFSMGQFKLSEKLANRPLMKHLSARGIRGASTGSNPEGAANPGVYQEPYSVSSEKFISV
jgi:hypothetical protein